MRTRVDEKRQLEIDLRTALERDELQVYYQPVMDLHVDRVTGLEALVRWHHPVRGNIEPEHFVPIAEECGLIAELGAFVLRTACTDAAAWPEPLKLAVNLSPLQLKDPQLFEQISAMLRASGVSPDRLEIEFTEGAVVHHSEATLALLTQLRTSGISVTFDDFGTGYSSLSNLLRFPFDKIKIDRSFLEHVDTSTSAETVVRAVVGLGAHLNLLTTGEGVETYRQLELLRDCGCTQAQGFLFSAAIPNHDVPFMVRELNSRFAHALP
jgi:EAL domain-containing protein (putative c-di-GMP-specific phosphodiesterase class I)